MFGQIGGAETVGQFRPLVIFSAIYRSWSTARARPLLKFLASIADDTQFGFLPGRESLEISFLLQGLIELMTLTEGQMTGLVTDIQKAFECIPRHPMLELALHIGAPEPILNAWSSFLGNMERRFQVRGEISEAHISNAGVPEGCAMSCFAMGIVDLCYHYYSKHFAPEVVPLTFVDNIGVLAEQANQLLHGTLVLQEFLSLWKLDMDAKKSWTWCTNRADMSKLHTLGYDVRTEAGDQIWVCNTVTPDTRGWVCSSTGFMHWNICGVSSGSSMQTRH